MARVTTIATAQTTSGVTTATLWTSPAGFQGGGLVIIQAHRPFNGDQASWWYIPGRSDADNSVIVDAGTSPFFNDAGASTWTVSIAENSNTLRIQVTAGAYVVNWTGFIQYWTNS